MSKRWWISDIHANHANICRYAKRPWLKSTDVNENGDWISQEAAIECAKRMNEGLIREINMRVKSGDRVVHVGDFATRWVVKGTEGLRESYTNFLNLLNGTWTLLRGNHDDQAKVKTIGDHLLCKISHFRVFVTHYPTDSDTHDPALIEWVHSNCHFAIVGHVHDHWDHKWTHTSHGKPSFLNINVGVDVRNYRPISDAEVINEYNKLKRGIT